LSVRIFAYGSNLYFSRMTERVPSAQVVGCALLSGCRLCFHKRSDIDGSGKANVIAGGAGDCVWGVVYEIAPADLPALDRCEGGYARRAIEVELTTGERVGVEVYVAESENVDERVRPFAWYKRLVVDGARMHGLPAEYVEVIACAPTCD
jgi:cation transport regulator ChaC